MRTRALRIAAPVTAAVLALAACGGSADTAEAEAAAPFSSVDMTDEEYATYMAELEQKSKDEGGVLSYYFSAPAANAETQINAFIEKYPWVKLEYTSGETLELIEKIINENNADQASADVIQGGPLEDATLCMAEELCMEYDPRGEKDLPEDRLYEDCLCSVADYFTFHILYNTDKVSAEEAPKDWADLTDPKWAGRFGFNIDQLDWFATALAQMGEDEGMEMMEALAANNPVNYSGADGLEKLAAGEFDVAFPNTATRSVTDMIEEGAPIGVVTTPVTLAQPDMYFPMKNAPHPATAQLYMEWLMSDDWQQHVADMVVKIPIEPGAPIPTQAQGILDANEIFFETTENFGDFETRVEQQQTTFITGG